MATNNKTQTSLTVEQILAGTTLGRSQTVGHMEVIPIIPDSSGSVDDTFAPPDITAATQGYGNVRMTNDEDRPTIAPTGAGWVTPQAAQDHAIASAEFIPAKKTVAVDTAMCIQASQGGYIKDAKEFLILPATLRTAAIAQRTVKSYGKLWPTIDSFNKGLGVQDHGGHLVYFLKHFAKQLDEFVAEFELVPDQIGALVLVGGKVVGIERAPNPAFWSSVWTPLVRVCYGAVALQARKAIGDVPVGRSRLAVTDKSLAGIAAALSAVKASSAEATRLAVAEAKAVALFAGAQDRKFGDYGIFTVANQTLAGQIVGHADGRFPYLSVGVSAIQK